ncbi:uncharacterized protein PWA37_000978 [Arxiozyma heterogenica]|uniref:uncharacterized protein n=1 Tax=Arxiozyma heterogenica TaxID=278026 RepID=UPI002EE20063
MLRPQQQKWFYKSFLSRKYLSILSKLQMSFPNKKVIENKFHFEEVTTSINDALTKYKSFLNDTTKNSFVINGWIDSPVKKIGNKLYFATLRDPYGTRIQLVDKHEPSLLKACNSVESCVQIKGQLSLKKQPKKKSN